MFDVRIETLIYLLLFMPLLGALVNGLLGSFMQKRWVSIVGAGSVFASFFVGLLVLLSLVQISKSGVESPSFSATLYRWIETGWLSVDFSLWIDPLSMVMVLVVTGVGSFIHLYSVGYMHKDHGYHRYFAYLNLFTFSMLLLVMGRNLLMLFIGWEGVGLCSYLLIGFWFEEMEKAIAGKKAFIVNRIGDFGFLLAIFVIVFVMNGSLDIPLLKVAVASGSFDDTALATLVCLLLFLGATGKSAQIPLYIWLPDAMAGPTPVSALIHAATMVTAGVYMIARLNFLYLLAPTAMAVVTLVGALTAFFAATIGLAQNDIKRVLAYSTVSQLGYMFVGVGVGAFGAAIFHLMTHAFFKACLFLGSGCVIHAMNGEQDIRNMGGLRKKLPITNATFLISTMAISGVPLLSGFFSKDEILFKTVALSHNAANLNWVKSLAFSLAISGAILTAFYMFRLYFITFTGNLRSNAHPHESPPAMTIPLIVLAFGSLFAGYIGLPHEKLNIFEHFLHPVFAGAEKYIVKSGTHTLEFAVMGISIIAASVGIALAYLFYVKKPSLPDAIALKFKNTHALILNKYYVDEIYGFLFVRPLKAVADFLYTFMDALIIDGLLVNGSANLARGVGSLARYLHNGDVQRYAGIMLIGTAVLLYFMIL